ncbi:hypothetical protein [Jeotgalibaca porci]|uniref:hypothetical protein n=1 Tax=Jeotgalibaca porci TaxID=1868793 RepID=UPI0035A0A0E7
MGKTKRRISKGPWGLGVMMQERRNKSKSKETVDLEREQDLLRKKLAKKLKK